MTPDTARLMASYNRWMNTRLYAAAGGLDEAALHAQRGAFFGSIFGTLNHLVAADTIWLHRLAQHPDAAALRAALAPLPPATALRQTMADTLAALGALRQQLDATIEQWAHGLTAVQLDQPLAYRNMAGQAQTRHMGHLVQHFFNHQTHHRGQASTLLFQAGIDIGVTDLLAVIPALD